MKTAYTLIYYILVYLMLTYISTPYVQSLTLNVVYLEDAHGKKQQDDGNGGDTKSPIWVLSTNRYQYLDSGIEKEATRDRCRGFGFQGLFLEDNKDGPILLVCSCTFNNCTQRVVFTGVHMAAPDIEGGNQSNMERNLSSPYLGQECSLEYDGWVIKRNGRRSGSRARNMKQSKYRKEKVKKLKKNKMEDENLAGELSSNDKEGKEAGRGAKLLTINNFEGQRCVGWQNHTFKPLLCGFALLNYMVLVSTYNGISCLANKSTNSLMF